ncbi:MAG TPA: hypothetical protein VFX96_20025 [Pyrinomonadaceae bacterium]|nr:hypothetical protein [Pyrinomonadaceae bacterium]
MTPEADQERREKEKKVLALTLLGAWLAISGFVVAVLPAFGYRLDARNVSVSLAWPLALVLLFWFLGRTTLLFHRVYLTLEGSSKVDFFVDLGRLLGLLGLIAIPYNRHGTHLLSYEFGGLFAFSSVVLVISLVIPYMRRQTRWDVEYNRRKVLLTTAINYAAVFMDDPRQRTAIRNMEANVLLAIKSYLEFSVLDTEGSNFSVNLIVRNPDNPQQLVCINRATAGEIPKYYPVGSLAVAMTAMKEQKPVYNGRFESKLDPPKPFKTIWQVPIGFPPGANTLCIGLLAIDSRKGRHLDVKDGRRALLFNLAPYIAMLRYALLLRAKYGYWE